MQGASNHIQDTCVPEHHLPSTFKSYYIICPANVINNRLLVNKGEFRLMKGLEVKNKIEKALSEVLKTENDAYLLQKDIHERTIAHKLATYLQSEFKNYNVDVEYNGNVLREDGKKKFEAFKDELQLCGRLRKKEEKIDEEIIERDAYPDIIIHKRYLRELMHY